MDELVSANILKNTDRLKAMALDHIINCILISAIMLIPFLISSSTGNWKIVDACMFVAMGLYFNKDCFRGRSLAKRIMGQVVVDSNSMKPANSIKCLIRNLMIPLWIIEVIVILFIPKKRIGDWLATTKVVATSKEDPKLIIAELRNSNIIAVIALVSSAAIYCMAFLKYFPFCSYTI